MKQGGGTINIEGSWYTLRDLEIDGGSHGVRVGTSAHTVFENLHIHDTGDVGLSCNRPDNSYEAITIRKLHIHDTGIGGGPVPAPCASLIAVPPSQLNALLAMTMFMPAGKSLPRMHASPAPLTVLWMIVRSFTTSPCEALAAIPEAPVLATMLLRTMTSPTVWTS